MMLNDFPKTFLPFDKIETDRHLRKGKQMIGALIQSSYIIGNKRRRKWNEVLTLLFFNNKDIFLTIVINKNISPNYNIKNRFKYE